MNRKAFGGVSQVQTNLMIEIIEEEQNETEGWVRSQIEHKCFAADDREASIEQLFDIFGWKGYPTDHEVKKH